ncbi:MAG TPA: hypothetical protein DEG71_01185 [Clostridiales bacterium]|nr:hypothetical protein [Clostridiales bacterium]
MGQDTKIREVNKQEVHNCLKCDFAIVGNGYVECHRRESEGVIVKITEDQIYVNCAAGDAEQYNVGGLSDKYLDSIKGREYKRDLELRSRAYENVVEDFEG